MPWNTITISPDRVAAGDEQRMLNEVEKALLTKGSPHNAAVFGGLTGGLRDQAIYFNPAASEIVGDVLARWGAVECEDPGAGVALLIGHHDAYDEQNKVKK